jgi:hypothetical protein
VHVPTGQSPFEWQLTFAQSSGIERAISSPLLDLQHPAQF